jgi:hypothetical protein
MAGECLATCLTGYLVFIEDPLLYAVRIIGCSEVWDGR